MQESKLEQAKAALQGDITFAAILKDDTLITSEKKGIAPMMALLSADEEVLAGAVVADRVIGRAAALLMQKAGVAQAYGSVVSTHALKVFQAADLSFSYDREVDYIINRAGNGMCPMEQTVLDLSDPEEAYAALRCRLAELSAR